MANSASATIRNRPYRSHRVPACTRCRARKIRCQIDIPNESCLFCRERRLKCQYVETQTGSTVGVEDGGLKQSKRARVNSNNENGDTIIARPLSAPTLQQPSSSSSASIMLAPHVAEDVDILERHISRHRPPEGDGSGPYRTLFNDSANPIVYLSVPRYRAGLQPELGAGKEQLEVVEQILGPFKQEVVDLYFTHIHPNFPILDEDTCSTIGKGSIERVSRALACVIYAIAAPHWRKSETLKLHPKPDAYYMWNKGISSLLEDFLSPSLATVAASILDQIGRPSTSIVGNILLNGRTVSLAQIFGLNRDPTKWAVSENEKCTRIRLWWGVLINDYWSSISYGAPPHVAKGFYDVPIPTLDTLVSAKSTIDQKQASTCFIHLCALTELLGDILPLVFNVRNDPDQLERSVKRLRGVMNDKESKLPEWLPLPYRQGSSNLWLCFLSIRLLLCRLALRVAILKGDHDLQSVRLGELSVSSAAVLDFVLFFGQSQFNDFWFAYAGHMLVQATMVSLRCTVEAKDLKDRHVSIARLERVMAHIQSARDDYDWDIANLCLERCSSSVSKMASLADQEPPAPTELVESTVTTIDESVPAPALDDPSFLLSDMLDANQFDFSWEALWDTPSGLPNFCAE
ncbi:C6 transcription factor-like protein [Lojkania enalia]|uniref:C6 transcription factor-like protein n=1 Tax=Lojkania enalia TaxID=147567 RepID=A0A9P4N9H0_9PLEO|nr:C6 transcription factor-like protein [Didymosphaeria enalia]